MASLRNQDSSVNTERTYASRVALYLTWCADQEIPWSSPTVPQLGRLLHWLHEAPLSPRGRTANPEPRYRSKGTSNAILGTVCRFLSHCALLGWVSPDLIALLSEPRRLWHVPAGMNPGEDGQFLNVRARTLRYRAPTPGFEYFTEDQVSDLINATTHARDRFLVTLLCETGVRIGEALGLRREDMHFLANSSSLGCREPGPHIHVRRRQNVNGALSKARQPRWIPVSPDTVGLYAAYQWERNTVAAAASTDMVFVNLFALPYGSPMKYPSTYELFKRISARCGFDAHPHMTRHTAATRWLREGRPRHIVQNLLGHVSAQSMDMYAHASDQEKRDAVLAVTAARKAVTT
ncbi:tyrosine-type recombinase/integrase [Streptomyces sp. NPDC046866]|uniref:tyrosine-type recombinase/integrase n=1 Tax=Streptomyces sp. NPDC046866 TaxID=3154921 RepID=UPI00345352EB